MGKRTKHFTGQAAVNHLERCMTLSAMAEERLHDAQITWFAFLDCEEDSASWSAGGCPNDYDLSDGFGLSGHDRERFLDWCANQRHYFLLCESGVDDLEASSHAQNDRSLLKGRPKV